MHRGGGGASIPKRNPTASIQSSAELVYYFTHLELLRTYGPAYATHKLPRAVRDNDGSCCGLLMVGIWCIDEAQYSLCAVCGPLLNILRCPVPFVMPVNSGGYGGLTCNYAYDGSR